MPRCFFSFLVGAFVFAFCATVLVGVCDEGWFASGKTGFMVTGCWDKWLDAGNWDEGWCSEFCAGRGEDVVCSIGTTTSVVGSGGTIAGTEGWDRLAGTTGWDRCEFCSV